MPYVPNPAAIAGVKAVTYLAFGAAIHPRGASRNHAVLRPIAFSVLRTLLGWLIGAPILLLAMGSDLSSVAIVAVLALPRFILSYVLIQTLYRPRGGRPETAILAALCVALAATVDLVLLFNFEKISWLRIPWC